MYDKSPPLYSRIAGNCCSFTEFVKNSQTWKIVTFYRLAGYKLWLACFIKPAELN